VGTTPVSAAIGDVNGDGLPDLAVVNNGSNSVSILLGQGNGTFTAGTSLTTGNAPSSIALADLNGDGIPDLAVTNATDNTVTVFLGSGGGSFQSGTTSGVGAGPVAVVTGDFNGDGVPDLAVANGGDDTVWILLGQGNGTFTAGSPIAAGQTPASMVAADLNGDGILDLAVADSAGASASILLGNGNGTFTATNSASTGNGPSGLAVADLNGDGIPDLAVANAIDNTAAVLLGNGNGTFQTALSSATGTSPASTAVGDFNGDGRLDLAVADQGSGAVSVLIQAPLVTLTPGTLTFASQVVGTTSAAQTVTLTNTGSATLSVSSIAAGGDFSQTNACGASLAAGANCTISVTFTPTTTGTRTGAVTVTDSASGSPQTLTLSGNGTLPAVSLTPGSLSFGNQQVGTASAAKNVTLANTGTGPLTIAGISFGGSNPSDFGQSNTCPVSPATLASGSTCVISVIFGPTAAGPRSASLSVTDNASGSPQSVTLTGTGLQPIVTLAPTSLAFSSQAVGTSSAAKTVTLKNTGTATLTLTSITITGANGSDFSQTNTCGGSVATGGKCAISVIFSPTANGSRSASLSIVDNAPGSPQTAGLSGTGTGPAVKLAPASLTFSVQKVGTTSAVQKVNLINSGSAALAITSVAITGNNAGDFSQTSSCPLSPPTLASQASCTVSVTFDPTAGGTRSAAVSVTDNASGSPQAVPLTGTGAAVQLSPASLNFGTIKVGKTSAARTVTLTNLGNTALSITSIMITGTNSGDFAQTNTCGGSVGGGQSCSISVTFTPSATGSRSASISITDSGGNSPQTVTLAGTGS
jgi:hypothetical protein